MPGSKRRILAAALVAGLLTLSACTHTPFEPLRGRVVAPPPASLRPTFGGWGFHHELHDEVTGPGEVHRFRFRVYDDVLGAFRSVEGELWLPPDAPGAPLIVVFPILGGVFTNYIECRIVTAAAARRGYASFFLYQDEILLKPDLDATRLEQLLRSDVRANGQALAVIGASDLPLDATRVGTFGISLGGIRSILLAAAEPRAGAHVTCLAGAGLGPIFRRTAEHLVREYIDRRSELALCSRCRVLQDVAANLVSDPLRVGQSVDPASVLLLLARFDRHVPISAGRRLHEVLGRPELRVVPLGHYSSVLVFPWAIGHAFDFYDRRLREGVELPP